MESILLCSGLGQSDEDEDETVKGAVEVVIKEVGEGLKECGQSPLSESQITALRQQLQEIASPDHRVRQLASEFSHRLCCRYFVLQEVDAIGCHVSLQSDES